MQRDLYTESEETWLRDNYRRGTINDTLDAFEAEFGRRPSKYAIYRKAYKMGLKKVRHSEDRSIKVQKRSWKETKDAEHKRVLRRKGA